MTWETTMSEPAQGEPGYIESGYRFTGGDAGDKNNWVNVETGKTEAQEEEEAAEESAPSDEEGE